MPSKFVSSCTSDHSHCRAFCTSRFWISNSANHLCCHFSNLYVSWHYVGIVRQMVPLLFSDISWGFESFLDNLRKGFCFGCIFANLSGCSVNVNCHSLAVTNIFISKKRHTPTYRYLLKYSDWLTNLKVNFLTFTSWALLSKT